MKLRALAAVAACLAPVAVLSPVSPADAAGCAGTPRVFSYAPTSSTLPGGATMRVWNRGTKVRVVAVTIPKGTLRPRHVAAGSLSSTAPPSTQVSHRPAAVVAINEGVFDPSNGTPVLSEAIDGHLYKSGSTTSGLAVTTNGELAIQTNRLTGAVTMPGTDLAVRALNEQYVPGGAVGVYTPMWGGNRRPSASVGITVKNGVVTRRDTPASATRRVPSGSLLLVANGSPASRLATLHTGAHVSVSYRTVIRYVKRADGTTPTSAPMHSMAGSSAYFVYGGKVRNAICNARNETPRPRSSVGFRKDGSIVVMAASGRGSGGGSESGGLTIHQEATLMQKLGAIDAVNLDGGTSTTLLVRKRAGGPFVRMDEPPGVAQRHVPNVLTFELPR